MPGDISTSKVQLARPKTSPPIPSGSPPRVGSGSRPLSRVTSRVQSRVTSGATSKTKDEDEQGDDEYHVELLEYEWPDLPPMPCMKDAITRQRVSKGISYLLPVDKGKNSINSRYRTDLRAMFQEPYADDDFGYDDNKVKLSAKVHFDTNSVDTKWTRKHFDSIPVKLNSDSENVRKIYASSAPPRGSRGIGIDVDKMRTRSSLFLPIKREEHPEAQKLREDVQKILQSVQMDEESDIIDEDEEMAIREQMTRKNSMFRKSKKSVIIRESVGHAGMLPKQTRLKLTAEKFKSYAQLKKTKPPKKTIPERFSSEFLSTDKNQEIWDWLHHGEQMSEFQFFLSVCG